MAGKEEDLYLILGLEKGLDSTESEIKKAYRKKALESHPDKRPNDKNAAAEFDKIQKAYEILGDIKARKAYDDLRKVQKAREDRDAQKGAKRQKMMDDLKKREEAFAHERSAEELAKMKLKAEIVRVRQENIARQKRQQEELAAALDSARRSSGGVASTPGADTIFLQGATLARTLKVTWDRSRQGGVEDYGAEKLRNVFSEFGSVEDVIINEDVKKKKRGSALVVLDTEGRAAAAIGAVCGDLSNPLLVKPAVPGLIPKGGAPGSSTNGGLAGSHVDGELVGSGANGEGLSMGDRKSPTENENGGNPESGVQKGAVNGHRVEGVNRAQTSGANHPGVSGVNAGQGGSEGGGFTAGNSTKPAGNGPSQRPNIFANGPPRPTFSGAGTVPIVSALSGAAAAAGSGSHKDYENVTLMRMRQAAERARLIREMEEQDAHEAAAEKAA